MNQLFATLIIASLMTAPNAHGKGFGGRSAGGGGGGGGARVSASVSPSKAVAATPKGNLAGKGATGASATKLFDNFKAKTQPPIQPNGKLRTADIDRVFSPSYRQERRQVYYSTYAPPARVAQQMNSTPSYGIWDAHLPWSFLDGSGDRLMYYNHMNDPGFSAWHADAERLAQTDPSIRSQLAALDAEMAAKRAAGVPVDPTYMTKDVDPDIYEANNIDPKTLAEIKVCTGSVGSDYQRYMAQISRVTKLKVKSVQGNGSVDNLAKLAVGECDLAFVQEDVIPKTATPNLLKIVTLNQIEGTLLVCGVSNGKGVSNVADLSAGTTVYVGSDQTGSKFTWDALAEAVPKLQTVKVDTTLPVSAIPSKVVGDNKACVFAVGTPDAAFFKNLDQKGKAQIVPIVDTDFKGKRGYGLAWLGENKSHITQDRFTAFIGEGGTDMLYVRTTLVAPRTWMDQNLTLFNLLMAESRNLQMSLQ